jgi:hypothetical protein
MSVPVSAIIALGSRPSTPLHAAWGGGLRPVLTAAAHSAQKASGRDGETALSQTEKHHHGNGPIILLNLTHITPMDCRAPLRALAMTKLV